MPIFPRDAYSKQVYFAFILLMCILPQSSKTKNNSRQFSETADDQATPNTIKLYRFLKSIQNKYTIIGHQDDLAYGNGWRYNGYNPQKYVSDIYNTCGDYPGVFGWDLGQIENKIKNPAVNYVINGVIIDDLKKWIKQVNTMGGINYFSWHANNPITGGNSWDNGDGTVVCKILEQGSQSNLEFNKYLDILADFFLSLKDENNQLIPILFRPFHEANMNNCFWWNFFNSGKCSHNNYKILWKYVEYYFTQVKQVHNILYVFSLNDNCLGYHKNEETMNIINEYPGDDCVDIVGYDLYMKNSFLASNTFESLVQHSISHNKFVTEFAQQHKKIPAITEAGWENYPAMEGPFTQIFPGVFGNYNYSFVLFWRNPDKIKDFTSYYCVYPDHPNAKDFKLFYSTTTKYIFRSKLASMRNKFITAH